MKKNLFLSLSAFVLLCSSLLAQPATWNARGAGGGGALFSPSINPGNASEFYVACDMTELFHSVDFGQTYTQLPFRQFEGGQLSKMCFTNNPGLLYCINNNFVSGISYPAKSTDNGLTWKTLPGPDTTQNAYTLDVDYLNPLRVVCSTYGNIYFSSNGGNTFTSIHTATVSADGNTVGGVFFDGNTIYIGTNDGVLVSANAGLTWAVAPLTGLPATEKLVCFAAGKTGSATRFYCLTAGTGNWNPGSALSSATGGGYAGFTLGVYTCLYGSGNWVPSMTGINLSNDYPMFLAMAGNDNATAYITGGSSTGDPIVLKTANSGTSWTHVFNTAGNQNIATGWIGQGGDHTWSFPEVGFGMAVCPTNSAVVLFSDYSDVHKSTDGGSSWQQGYVNPADMHPANANTPPNQAYHSSGLENTSCWQVMWLSATNLFSGYSDIRGVRSVDAGVSWSFNYTGNTANSTYRLAKAANGTVYAATSGIHDMYQSTHLTDARIDAADANGKVIASSDGGLTWTTLHTFGHPVFWIALDPNTPDRGYASVANHAGSGAAGGVYRCDNLSAGASSVWTLLAAPPRTEGHPASLFVLNDGKLIATFSARNASGFTASSGCFLYTPSSGTWADVSDPGMHYWTKDVTVDPNDATQSTWYVSVFCGWGGAPNTLGGLYKTTNRGASWTLITTLSNTHNVTSCTVNPNNANQLFMTTEYEGLWVSNNIQAGAPVFTPVNNYPFKQPERVFFNPYNTSEMWVTSFGNGMKMGLVNTTGLPSFEAKAKWMLYPNPSNGLVTLVQDESMPPARVEVFNAAGQLVHAQVVLSGKTVLNLEDLAAGVYVVNFNGESRRILLSK
jgi:hypothetical protein